jgi:hypothetical protein
MKKVIYDVWNIRIAIWFLGYLEQDATSMSLVKIASGELELNSLKICDSKRTKFTSINDLNMQIINSLN